MTDIAPRGAGDPRLQLAFPGPGDEDLAMSLLTPVSETIDAHRVPGDECAHTAGLLDRDGVAGVGNPAGAGLVDALSLFLEFVAVVVADLDLETHTFRRGS